MLRDLADVSLRDLREATYEVLSKRIADEIWNDTNLSAEHKRQKASARLRKAGVHRVRDRYAPPDPSPVSDVVSQKMAMAKDVVSAINRGVLDDYILEIAQACVRRKKLMDTWDR